MWLLISIQVLSAAPAPPSEYQLKAVFLFNFLQFVDWPASAFDPSDGALALCVLGPDPFGNELDAMIAGEQIGGRRIEVRRLTAVDAAGSCHLLFLNLRSPPQLRAALAHVKGRPILTVGNAEPFADLGGMIEFVMQEDRIRLRINLRAASEAQLHLSSKLLRRSEIVGSA